MSITFFSMIMAVACSSFLIIIIHLFRKQDLFLRTFGVHTILVLYLICVFRMCFTFETSLTVPVDAGEMYRQVYDAIRYDFFLVFGNEMDLLSICRYVWIAGALISLVRFAAAELQVHWQMQKCEQNCSPDMEEVLLRVQRESGRKFDISIYAHQHVDVPMGIGLFHRRIILPDIDYSKESLYYIIKHEYTHFVNRDLFIQYLTRLFCCVFWWNPLAYLLKRDVSQILEIRCDMTVTQNFLDEEKYQYLTVIFKSLRAISGPKEKKMTPVETKLFEKDYQKDIVERFEMMSDPPKSIQRVFQVLSISFAIAVLILSYSFVPQTFYEPPKEEIYTDGGIWEFDWTDAYILKHKDGTYSYVLNDGSRHDMSESAVKIFVETEDIIIIEE